jgi:hypothetical protein
VLLRVNDQTISKIGAGRRTLSNGLLQIIARQELHDQFRLYSLILDRWCRDKPVTFMPILHGAVFTWQWLMRRISQHSEHRERAIVAQSYGDGQTAVPVKLYHDWIIPLWTLREGM